ncbi:MAG: rRNA small subunit methyltransferase 1, partial [Candidatus Levybacteria bacterium]|nr:rRNA small subunit methyltransferase 1 [Candidatus Levybacteria bacterium]
SVYHKLTYDTQVKHLDNIEIKIPDLISYYEQNEFRRIPEIINALKNGLNIALVSDAGTPAISDPGFRLIRECIKEGILVESIPGPSSVITALVSSGLPTDKFLFLGYPPHKPGHRKQLYLSLLQLSKSFQNIQPTVVLLEAPHKLVRTLQEIKEVFGNIEIVICRELTKVHEEVRRESINISIDHFSKRSPQGEFVILFHI